MAGLRQKDFFSEGNYKLKQTKGNYEMFTKRKWAKEKAKNPWKYIGWKKMLLSLKKYYKNPIVDSCWSLTENSKIL